MVGRSGILMGLFYIGSASFGLLNEMASKKVYITVTFMIAWRDDDTTRAD